MTLRLRRADAPTDADRAAIVDRRPKGTAMGLLTVSVSALLALTACGERDELSSDASGRADREFAASGEPPAEPSTAEEPPSARDPFVEVNLEDFSCGDNCYLTIARRLEGVESETLLCLAPQCGEWREAGILPAALEGAIAEVRFGRGEQRDADGNVMNAGVRTIAQIRNIRRQPTDTDLGAIGPLPLRPGVFVLDGEVCDNPANAGIRIWNGEGLSGSSTRNCRSSATKTGQIEWRVENSCENTYDGKRTTETFTIAISDPSRFGMKSQSFRRCPTGQAPDVLERIARGEQR